MSYIIVTRNPGSKRLMVIETFHEDGERKAVAEYATEEVARAVADMVPICDAWGYAVVEVEL